MSSSSILMCNGVQTSGSISLFLFSSVRSPLNRLEIRECLMSRTIALPVAAVIGAGCNGRELPTLPASVNPPVPITLTISHVGPKEGWPFYYTEVFGTGFNPGVRLTFGGVGRSSQPRRFYPTPRATRACPVGPSRTFLMDEGGAKQRDAPRNRRPGAADDRRDLRAGNRVRFTSRANANEDER